jgi:hypothetical protein
METTVEPAGRKRDKLKRTSPPRHQEHQGPPRKPYKILPFLVLLGVLGVLVVKDLNLAHEMGRFESSVTNVRARHHP